MRRAVVLLLALVVLEAPVVTFAATSPSSDSFASAFTVPVATSYTWVSSPSLKSIRYRPRRRQPEPEYAPPERIEHKSNTSGFAQLHGGFFDPDGVPERGVLFGLRAGTSINQRVQLGIGVDWSHRSDRQVTVVREVPVPGGGTAQQTLVQAESSSDLIPMMAVFQVSPVINSPLLPYFGIGGGYQLLLLSSKDFNTGQQFDATYGGWAWQAWGGLGIPLGGRMRLNGEAFLNYGNVERDVDDPTVGIVREVINLDGAGVRAGLGWGF